MRLVSLALLLCVCAFFAQAEPKLQYEVFAIRFATFHDASVSQFVAGADKARELDINFIFWLVRGNGRDILVDSGFYHERFFHEYQFTGYNKPSEAVARMGLKPEDMADIIITHMHWDHVDGMDLFPKARIWSQKEELEYYAGQAWQARSTHSGIDPEDVVAAVKLNTEGHVALVNGDAQEIFPGITCYTGGKHTYASQFVGINSASGTIVLASDNLYLYENLEKHVAIAATLDPESNLHAQDRMKELATDARLIIPGHDPKVMKRFPEIAPGVVKIQ